MDNWVKSIVSLAPTVAGFLGGPLAGSIATVVAKTLGVSEEELSKINPDDPEIKVKLQQLENDMRMEMYRIDAQLFNTEVTDRDSARNREIQLKDWTPSILAYLYTFGAFAYVYAISYHNLTLDKEYITLILGWLFAKSSTVVDYYLGTSHKKEGS